MQYSTLPRTSMLSLSTPHRLEFKQSVSSRPQLARPLHVQHVALPWSQRTSVAASCLQIARSSVDELSDESLDFFPLLSEPGTQHTYPTTVYKFGGSSVADAHRMREVADIICAFPDEFPVVVMSAMGKTTNLLLEAGTAAIEKGADSISKLPSLRAVKELHRDSCDKLGCDSETYRTVEHLLTELQQLLTGISIMQELTPRAKDSLVSFGERLSTRVFAGYLRRLGIRARQYDAWDLGLVTSDEFTNAEIIYVDSIPGTKSKVIQAMDAERALPIVTGFLGRGRESGAITTLGRGGSDLTATFFGAALNIPEVVVWKDVDGVLTSDPRLVRDARVVEKLTYDEATELAYFGAQVLHPAAMYPAQLCNDKKLVIRVKNSYNLPAPGSMIANHRDMDGALLTSIVLKRDVRLLDVVSTRMLGNFGFLARVFEVFKQEEVSVDVVATSEISVSVTLDCAKMWSRDLIGEELTNLQRRFKGIANVEVQQGVSIISLICNAEKSSIILHRVFGVLRDQGVNVRMMSQGASKTNISLIVSADQAPSAVVALHAEFFGVSDTCAASEGALSKAAPTTMI